MTATGNSSHGYALLPKGNPEHLGKHTDASGGAGQSAPGDPSPCYSRSAVEHVLAVGAWRPWGDLLEYLRGDGPGDPGLDPDQLQDLRQDAERACCRGETFVNDRDALWALVLRTTMWRGLTGSYSPVGRW